ncbi:MAG: hypothetical protein ACLFVW_05840 [Phycisphaerae bacterium]
MTHAMKTFGVVAALLLVVVAMGCEKKVTLTTMNHTDESLSIRYTTPDDGSRTAGTVGPGGSLTHSVRVKEEELPVQCSYRADNLAGGTLTHTNFPITKDTPGKLWFHVTSQGRLAGPYTKDDVHVESRQGSDVQIDAGQQMIVE